MLEKYEIYIENYFEPDFPLHQSRPHSPMYGKIPIFSDSQLASDPIGYYSKNLLVSGEPIGSGFHEEYPNASHSWYYEQYFIDPTFDYTYTEDKYKVNESKEDFKKKLDVSHRS